MRFVKELSLTTIVLIYTEKDRELKRKSIKPRSFANGCDRRQLVVLVSR
jgi:hypothetical protein